MDAPQLGTAAITIICAVLCAGALLIGGVLFVVARSGILGDVFGGLGVALGRQDEDLGQDGGLFGEDTAGYGGRKRKRGGARSVEEIRQQYDRQFNANIGADPDEGRTSPPMPSVDLDDTQPSGPDPAKRRYKRRFSEENADLDDEIDSFIDDFELD